MQPSADFLLLRNSVTLEGTCKGNEFVTFGRKLAEFDSLGALTAINRLNYV